MVVDLIVGLGLVVGFRHNGWLNDAFELNNSGEKVGFFAIHSLRQGLAMLNIIQDTLVRC